MARDTKSKLEEIIKLHSQGLTDDKIAELLDDNVPAIRYWLKKSGLKSNPKIHVFTKEEKEKMKSLYKQTRSSVVVAKALRTTQSRVLHFLNTEGIDTSQVLFKGDLADFAIKQYESGMTQEEIAEYHGCERQAVQALFKREGIVGRSQLEQKKITWPVNQEAFTDWSNETDLFFYGLLLADGCLSDDGSVSLTLQYQDAHIVEAFRNYVESKNKLYVELPCKKGNAGKVSLKFQDQVIADNLRKVGMEERKSTKEKLPTFDMSDLGIAKHFWRGYICGDGSVRSYPSNGTERLMPTLYVCGSEEICEGFREFCSKVVARDIRGTVKKTNDPRRSKDLYYFRLNGLGAKIVALFMFEGANYYIKRKMENAISFKDYTPKIDRTRANR